MVATFPGWHEEEAEDEETGSLTGSIIYIKPFANRPVVQVSVIFGYAAMIMGFISALYQHTAAVTAVTVIKSKTAGAIVAHVGRAATALVWSSAVLNTLVLVGLMFIYFDFSNIPRLTAGEDEDAENDEDE